MRVDTRAGSNELIEPLKRRDVPAEPAILPAGDLEFFGKGPEGRPVPIGVEYKKLPDVLQCMRDGRFAEQLRGMNESYEVKWLLIEGNLRQRRGVLEVQYKKKWRHDGYYRYQEFASWLQTMCMRGGVLLWRTADQEETLSWIKSLWQWWTLKEYESHRAHLDWYSPNVLGGVTAFTPPTLVQKVSSVLPGVGGTRSISIAEHFASVREMSCAEAEEWVTIPGIGKKGAEKLVSALNGE